MSGQSRSILVDRLIRELAEAQDGVFAREQLVKAGVAARTIDNRLRTGRIELVFRGVYTLSRVLLGWRGWVRAAAMSVGRGAVVSHRSAAALWGMRQYRPPVTDITTSRHLRSSGRVRIHRLPIQPDEVTDIDGIPVTTPARTILDFAATAQIHELRRAWREADERRLTGGPTLATLVDRYPGRIGIKRARQLVANRPAGNRTRSDLEERFLLLIEARGLPQPEVNGRVWVHDEVFEVDFLWRRARVAVEIDTFRTHGSASAFEEDRRRDRRLHSAGFKTLRVTDSQLDGGARELAGVLSRATRGSSRRSS